MHLSFRNCNFKFNTKRGQSEINQYMIEGKYQFFFAEGQF